MSYCNVLCNALLSRSPLVPLARISRPAYAPILPEGTYVFDRPGGFFKMARSRYRCFFADLGLVP